MAINETISKGNKYRRLKDATNKVWQRISFWTAASDVEFNSGSTLESSLGNVTGITDSLTSTSSTVAASAAAVASLNSKITSFSGSLSDLYNAFVAKGVTPSAKTLTACVAAVNTLFSTAYAAGKADAEWITKEFSGTYRQDESVSINVTIQGYHAVWCGIKQGQPNMGSYIGVNWDEDSQVAILWGNASNSDLRGSATIVAVYYKL